MFSCFPYSLNPKLYACPSLTLTPPRLRPPGDGLSVMPDTRQESPFWLRLRGNHAVSCQRGRGDGGAARRDVQGGGQGRFQDSPASLRHLGIPKTSGVPKREHWEREKPQARAFWIPPELLKTHYLVCQENMFYSMRKKNFGRTV